MADRKDIGQERQFSPEYIRERLSYCPDTGMFHWMLWPEKGLMWNTRFANQRAGCRTRHYVKINIDKSPCMAHRLAWTYVHGTIPQHMLVDHINGDGFDNRITNLRLATQSENQANWSRIRDGGLPRGISFYKPRGTFVAKLFYRGRMHYFGYHKTIDDALAAYRSGVERLHGDFVPWRNASD